MAGKARKVLAGVGIALLAVVVCAAGFEGVLRLGWVDNFKHGVDRTDRRWEELEHRVLVLGDSFIVPYGLLGRLLAEDFAARGVAVRNQAVSGTGPFEYLERLQQFAGTGLQLPDVVLLGYYAGNDLTDVQDNPKFSEDASSTAIRTGIPPFSPLVKNEWYHELNAFHYLRPFFVDPPAQQVEFDWSKYEALGIETELIEDAKARRINRWLLALAHRNPHHLLDNVLMETERNARAWERSRELITRIHGMCDERGVRLLVVMFPRSVQIDDSHFDFFRRLKFEVDERTLVSTVPQTKMAELCAELDVPLLDLLPAFEADGRQLYLEKDDHLNLEGHHFAAERIVPWVMEHLPD
jgi:lysophospholipase L1-like esterase